MFYFQYYQEKILSGRKVDRHGFINHKFHSSEYVLDRYLVSQMLFLVSPSVTEQAEAY